MAVSRRKHDPRAPDCLGFAIAIPNDRLEPRPVRQAQVDAEVVSSHGRKLTDLQPHGNHLSVTANTSCYLWPLTNRKQAALVARRLMVTILS